DRSRYGGPLPLGSVQTNSWEKAAADRGTRRIWPQVQAWRQPSAPIGAFKTRDASGVIAVTQGRLRQDSAWPDLPRRVADFYTRVQPPPIRSGSPISILH